MGRICIGRAVLKPRGHFFEGQSVSGSWPFWLNALYRYDKAALELLNSDHRRSMKLDLSALQDAITALDKSLGYLYSDLAKDPDLREQFRAACILAFEFTYEVVYKMLKRQLEH